MIKARIIIIVAAVIVLLLSLCGYLWKQNRDLNVSNNQLVKVADDSSRVAKTLRNKNGVLVSHNNVLMLSNHNVKELLKTSELNWLNKYNDVLKKNGKNLESAGRISEEVVFSKTIPFDSSFFIDFTITDDYTRSTMASPVQKDEVKKVDSVLGKSATYQDEFNTVNTIVFPDSVRVKGTIRVPIEEIVYWQRSKKFLFIRWGDKKYFSEVSSANPWVVITNHEVIKVSKSLKK